MKAFVIKKYGGPERLKLEEIERPVPKENELLVRVKAVSVNPMDWHLMRGAPLPARMLTGLFKPKAEYRVLGSDIAGVVEAVGAEVTCFRPGDEVFGYSMSGGFAEQMTIAEKGVYHKPAGLTFEEAAAVPVAAITAFQGQQSSGSRVQAGQRVLINGASGGVGTFAVQMAKAFGAEVTAVCSGRNSELVQAIGADHVINYKESDFSRNGKSYDFILDAVADRPISDLKRALTPQGSCIIVGYNSMSRMMQYQMLGSLNSKSEGQKIGMIEADRFDRGDMLAVRELLEEGKIRPVIDRKYRFREIPEAIAYLEKGRARGKVVVTID